MKNKTEVTKTKEERLIEINEKIRVKEELMTKRGYARYLEGQPEHNKMYNEKCSHYGVKSLRELYFQREILKGHYIRDYVN